DRCGRSERRHGCGRRQRKPYLEDRTLADAVAVRRNNPAVQGDQLLYQRKAEAETWEFATDVALAETIENPRDGCGIDAAPIIGDRQLRTPIDGFETHIKLPAVGGEFDSVCNQMGDDLTQPRRVGLNSGCVVIELTGDGDRFGLRLGAKALDHLDDDLNRLRRLERQ